MADGDDFENLNECPVCFERLLPPVETCENGHAICQECREKIESCPTCRTNFTMNKNTLLNKMLESIPLACKYRTSGCDLQKPIKKIKEHEKICNFRKEKCNICEIEIFYPDISDHFTFLHVEDHHKKSFSQSYPHILERKEHATTCSFGRYYINDIKIVFLNQTFVNWESKIMNYCVQYLGNREEASNYYYTIEIDQKLPGKNKQLYTCGGLCIPYIYEDSEWISHERTITLNLNQIFLNNEDLKEIKWSTVIHQIVH